MYKAIQELKTRAGLKHILVGFLLLAAAFGLGFISHDRTTSLVSQEAVVQQEPQITIQKQPPVIIQIEPEEATVNRKQYKVLSGDSLWTIANRIKPHNVEVDEYVKVLKVVNSDVEMHPGTMFEIPSADDLKEVTLPDVLVHFDITDETVINHIKKAEGTSESQAVLKRRLLGGKVGPSFKNGKFYPYRDSTGHFTIGYGHYLGKSEKDAAKYRNGISKRQAHDLLLTDMQRTMNDFVLLLQRKRAVDLTVDQQRILYEMAFTLGVDKLSRFNKMWKSVENNNQHKFKTEIANSLWYKQMGNRAVMLVNNL
ncbi:lysozyme [Cronobacter phage vB_CsaM_GAP32]|uniref:Lysozyme n=1 Tax=Cronobacter phage vB_CsaM_GAP32 TaxID=1141136 RepID=K4F9J6_9CAUD|nr:lysozyme [Cronobacter phage vB_CsaM_GAP32]AFC21630.1 lysozyme [Cronobacter phage vB_CsaM_GAP32]